MKVNLKQLLLLTFILNAGVFNTVHAEEVDEEFLDFLADMEESTGTGFDQWLEDSSIDAETNEIAEPIEY